MAVFIGAGLSDGACKIGRACISISVRRLISATESRLRRSMQQPTCWSNVSGTLHDSGKKTAT